MTKAIPVVHKYMTTSPHFVGDDQTLAFAHELMSKHRIRHLPVLHGGSLVGMITERDLALIETLREVEADKVTVGDAMSTNVYTVSPEAALDEVVATMAQRKLGSAVVMQNHRVVGILTTVDVCRTLGELLHGRLAS